MDRLVIQGGLKLSGEIPVGGAKNAALPLIAAAILTGGQFRIHNIQPLSDIRTMCRLLGMLGADSSIESDTLILDTTALDSFEAPYDLVKTMRASIYVLGPLLARFSRAKVSLPGGCAWGPRPVNLHLEGMKRLGAEIELEGGYIHARTKRLKGARIKLDFPSVGATGNLMMAAVSAEGETVLENAAREPDIATLAHFLKAMGAEIEGAGSSIIKIQGGQRLQPCEFENVPDRIEAGTFMIAAAIAGGKVRLARCQPRYCEAVMAKLRLTGCRVDAGEDWVEVVCDNQLESVNVTTEVYPGFPTDLQAQWIALMTQARGISQVKDTIYPDRFTHVAELARLGADIKMSDGAATVYGKTELKGAPVMSTDIRASASLILAGLAAKGSTEVSRVYHIDRGYYRIEEKLARLGADIRRERG